MSRIRVLIADDHAVVRDGLARVLQDQPDMRVVAQAADGATALARCREHEPHVVLLDMRMPGLGGAAAIKRLREECPTARVLVLSMYEDPHYVRAAMAAGAHAYLGKRASANELLAVIRELHARGLVGASPGAGTGSAQAREAEGALSAREREILELVLQGHTSRAMANLLGIRKSTVDTYRARVFRKLGVDSRAALYASLQARDEEPGDET